MIDTLTALPLFGLLLTCFSYVVGVWVNKKLQSPLTNPLIIAVAFCILVLHLLDIPLANYRQGGDFIALFLLPATASLALTIYRQYAVLKANLIPVLAATAVGTAVSMSSVLLLCHALHLDELMAKSLLAKSVTTAIAIEVTKQQGGIIPITVAAVVVTGVLGAILSPCLIRFLRIEDPISRGLAIGTSSHALGTTKALELGAIEGAMSSIAIGMAGLETVLFVLFFS